MVATGQTEYLVFGAEKEDGIIIWVANPHSRMKNQELHRMFEKGYSTKGEDRVIGMYHVRKLVQGCGIDLVSENRMIEDRNYICFTVMIGKRAPLS